MALVAGKMSPNKKLYQNGFKFKGHLNRSAVQLPRASVF